MFTDLQGDAARLSSLGVAHGDMVYLLYHFERSVRPAYQRSAFEKRPFGASGRLLGTRIRSTQRVATGLAYVQYRASCKR